MQRTLDEIIAEGVADFHAVRLNCAESVVRILSEYYGWNNPAFPRVATAFGGGIGGTQDVCGAFTGGVMAIGMLMGREAGGDRAPAVDACLELRARMLETRGALTCRGILEDVRLDDPLQAAAFRAEGGKHQTVCEPMVAWVCRHVAERWPRLEDPA
jgi:C_GCAxxG_C_C family probable redox protein